ncbi:MAG: tRNA (guanosine(46)-N7)-methyltransferase TrmB [Planctomycetota bacterium]
MVRRQLRSRGVPDSLDNHFCLTDELPERVTSNTLFENDHPLEIEIGSGKGLFMRSVSERQPESNFLGIEVAYKYAQHAATGLAKDGRGNAMMASGDAMPIMNQSVPDASLAAVHVYFPDPWWKKRHKKRRVLSDQMLNNIDRTLMPGGRFHFWTDVLEYFENVVQRMAEIVPQLGPPIPEQPPVPTHDLDFRTHFERRSHKLEIPVYRVRFDKPA